MNQEDCSWDIMVVGDRVTLVPYEREHVPQYHEWMQDAELLELTKSEPLSLNEEYKMQASWKVDQNKNTFILLDRSRPDESSGHGTMAGDVNLYWNEDEHPTWAEIEVMVAERQSRGKGLAGEALQLMMCTAMSRRAADRFTAKITTSNAPSRRLFEKLGFVLVKEVACFDEVHYELSAALAAQPWAALQAMQAAAAHKTEAWTRR